MQKVKNEEKALISIMMSQIMAEVERLEAMARRMGIIIINVE